MYLCGVNYGTIENCHVDVNSEVSGVGQGIGGIAGINESDGRIIACSNAATVTGSDRNIGGICGASNRSSLIACYNTGNISGVRNVGGITGRLGNYVSVISCYYTQGGGTSGTQVTAWNADIINDMNSALQTAGYSYQYELGSNELPVIKTME